MNWTFNFNSLGGFFRSFRKADSEVNVPISKGRLKIQTRLVSGDAHHCLRFSNFGHTAYFDMTKDDLLKLADALVEVADHINVATEQ